MLKVETISALEAEIERCRAKFPNSRFLVPALIEEVGELAAVAGAISAPTLKSSSLSGAAPER